jgi:hypothetical protein
MTQEDTTTVRLKVSPEIARIVKPGAPREVQLAAARGALPFSGKDLLTVLFFLCSSQDVEIKKSAVMSLRGLPEAMLIEVLEDKSLPPQQLELLARARMADINLMTAVIMHPAVSRKLLLILAEKGSSGVLERLAARLQEIEFDPELVAAIAANPAAGEILKEKLGDQESQPIEPDESEELETVDEDSVDLDDGRSQTELEELMEEADREGLSKYQIALDLKVAEKIKMGLTGDKEWRTILIKDANKLVHGAVLKNPRVTDGEVLMVAKNKTSSDEMVRIILLNKEWMKNYEIRKALITHPKTPLPKALRFVNSLSLKDIKDLARSRQVSRVISTAARKELEQRNKKTGG